MKILHINTYDTGGAANACLRIHKALLNKGVDSKVLVLYKSKDIPEVYEFNYWDNTSSRLGRFFKRRKYEKYRTRMNQLSTFITSHPVEMFTMPSTIFDITKHPLYKEADIIQLNWVSGFLDEPSFFKKNTKPVIWRMPDMYVCGSGYHYEKGFPFDVYRELLDKNRAVRKKALKNRYINYVAISDWLRQKGKRSEFLKGQPITVIHNGIDPDIFKPYDKIDSREQLRLPQDKKIILIGAASLSSPRKGMQLALDAIDKLDMDSVCICTFGYTDNINDKIISLGPITDNTLLAKLYSASDLFIMSSIEEAFGQVFIESLACGTPVVSFPNGGGIDIIKDGVNGFLTKDFTSASLVDGIEKALGYTFDRNSIRTDTLDRFNITDKAEQYIKLYKSILNR